MMFVCYYYFLVMKRPEGGFVFTGFHGGYITAYKGDRGCKLYGRQRMGLPTVYLILDFSLQ